MGIMVRSEPISECLSPRPCAFTLLRLVGQIAAGADGKREREMNIVERAVDFAVKAHGLQLIRETQPLRYPEQRRALTGFARLVG